MSIKNTPCVLCQSSEYEELFSIGNYKILRCIKCKLVKTLGKLSVDYKHYHRDEEYGSLDNYFKNIFQKRYNIITKFKAGPGKVLDIGASTGVLLSIFRSHGWECWGVEPSAAGDLAADRGIKIIKGAFEKSKLPKDYFDVVIMNHTLEHVENPVEVLKKIYSLLRKNGLVYIDVPNFGSLSSTIAGRNWKYLHPYEHIHHFTPETLAQCLRVSGFKIQSVQTSSGIFDVANPVLKFWQTLTGFKKQFFTDIVEIPGNIISTLLNRGTGLSIIGKK